MALIWIVEDDRNLANLTKVVLVKNGYEVNTFHDAQTVMEVAKKQKPDLILMDLMLPEISGAEAVRELKKNVNFLKTPVIFITGLIGDKDLDTKEGINIDGIDYSTIGKPFKIEQLLEMVGKFCKTLNH